MSSEERAPNECSLKNKTKCKDVCDLPGPYAEFESPVIILQLFNTDSGFHINL